MSENDQTKINFHIKACRKELKDTCVMYQEKNNKRHKPMSVELNIHLKTKDNLILSDWKYESLGEALEDFEARDLNEEFEITNVIDENNIKNGSLCYEIQPEKS